MGLRNPYRLGVDPDTDVLYWGEVGPDARLSDPQRGPRHFEEFNRTVGRHERRLALLHRPGR